MEGSANIQINPFTADSIYIVGIKGGFVNSFKKKMIPKYITAYFQDWLRVWWFYHEKGLLPYGQKGWYEHNNKIITVIRMFESLHNSYDAKKQENHDNSMDKKINKLRKGKRR